jgi:hypothetical protein
MAILKKLLDQLVGQDYEGSENYPVTEIPSVDRHKIGLTNSGCPIFFINCDVPSENKGLDYNLEMISIKFNQRCNLNSKTGISQEDIYTIIQLKESSLDLENYFLDIMYLFLNNLPKHLSLTTLKVEITRLINLFNKISQPPKNTIQGLWSELLVIEQSENPSYLIKSWHVGKEDQFDFNNGEDKIEVKSTSKKVRIHTFANEQLQPNENSKLLIVSVLVQQTGLGTSIFDLVELIGDRLIEPEDTLKLSEMVATTLGMDLANADSRFFDYNFACENIAFFDYSVIPRISTTNIPLEITNVHYDVNLTSVNQIFRKDFAGELHSSL